MRCPFCAHQEDKVIDTRQAREGAEIRRRRECEACGRRFTTYERVEEALPQVIKKDGRREPFDREKIVRGLRHAFTKRPVPIETLLRLAEDVEREASESGEKEIAAKVVGEKLLPKIRALDPVAYVRFASIYREFRDVDEFMSELASLVKHRAGSAGPGGTGPGGTGPGGKASA